MGGFNLPPGVTVSMLPGNEPCGPCEVCGGDPESVTGRFACICPECPECGAFGDPACYPAHGLIMSILQIFGAVHVWKVTQQEIAAEQEYFAHMESEPEWI